MPFADIIGHERVKSILTAALIHDRIPHAYLFHGEDAIGKRLTAVRLVQALSCEGAPGPDGPDACGACRSCQQIAALTFPDLLVIEPDRERAAPQIKIEQIREIEHHVIYRPLVATRKTVLIDDAETMTLAAANALLKTLEEPPAHSLFVLLTHRPAALPVTVRSRCHALRFAPPAKAQVEAALRLARELSPDDAQFVAMVTEGRIGHALTAQVDALREQQRAVSGLASRDQLASIAALLSTAEALSKSDGAAEALDWLAYLVRELLMIRVGADAEARMNLALPQPTVEAARHASLDALLDVLEGIDRFQRHAVRHVNPQLTLEQTLLRLRDALLTTPDAPPASRPSARR